MWQNDFDLSALEQVGGTSIDLFDITPGRCTQIPEKIGQNFHCIFPKRQWR
jgi:hypothetical protein